MVERDEHGGVNLGFDENGEPRHKFVRLPHYPFKLRFSVSKGFSSSVQIITSYQAEPVELSNEISGEYFVVLKVEQPGTFWYRLHGGKEFGIGWFQVPPNLQPTIKCLDAIQLQTNVSKWMGPLREWWPHLEQTSKSGYNMIHFTPLQERGCSNSPYSLRSHLHWDNDLEIACEDEVVKLVSRMQNDLKLLSMIDIVWNHVSCDSPLLAQHPEMGYHLGNSPHLQMAYELDEAIMQFSAAIIGEQLSHSEDVAKLMHRFNTEVITKLALWEYFVLNVDEHLNTLKEAIEDDSVDLGLAGSTLFACRNPSWKRHSVHIPKLELLSYFADDICTLRNSPTKDAEDFLLKAKEQLDTINLPLYRDYDLKMAKLQKNLAGRIMYERVEAHGPKLGPVTAEYPIIATYFTRITGADGKPYAFANNGWIWNADPMVNFAEEASDAYFTRDVIVWGDCVKLRYGPSEEDSPFLWKYMEEYTRRMASTFYAFRIDNCHSTPIHLAEHLLKVARQVRPDLYVCAELFTGSEERDFEFVTRLGINSLIREAMAAWDIGEICRIITNYGGQPRGSLRSRAEYGAQGDCSGSTPHALFMDCTHDNETPSQKRQAADALSTAALVALSVTAGGSTRGFDELVPEHLNIVQEHRKFPVPTGQEGIMPGKLVRTYPLVRKLLSHWKEQLLEYSEIEVQRHGDLIVVERDHPTWTDGYTLITRPAFSSAPIDKLPQITLDAAYQYEVCLAAKIHTKSATASSKFIEGMEAELDLSLANLCEIQNGHLSLQVFPPGSIMLLKRTLLSSPIETLNAALTSETTLDEALESVSLEGFNLLLHRSDPEERDFEPSLGVYEVPGYGPLCYAGLQGFLSVLDEIREHNAMNHPLCVNLRAGDWAMEYTVGRLKKAGYEAELAPIQSWLQNTFELIKRLPRHLIPKYFDAAISLVVGRGTSQIMQRCRVPRSDDGLLEGLVMGSIQMIGAVKSTGLYPDGAQVSMSAGLPHFSTHHMRCWGRDTFISMRGLMLLPGRWERAREHLIAFAGCLYQGLIPNLLDSSRRPRYNARDATWWFLNALRQYCEARKDVAILSETVKLRHPGAKEYVDFDDPRCYRDSMEMRHVVREILQRHAMGISFREWNAGPALDGMMQSEGFNVDAYIDWSTGMVKGGNRFNCGTWMDKMGESGLAGNRGWPATPRNGAAVELQALLYETLCWVVRESAFGFDSVQTAEGKISMTEWRDLLHTSFEKAFWFEEGGFYRDCVGSENDGKALRPNFLVAMSISPDLFANRERARRALAMAEEWLVAPLGLRTLAPFDPRYRPDYHMHPETSDHATSLGFNYHNGPEWLWPVGAYLRSCLVFIPRNSDETLLIKQMIRNRLQPHRLELERGSGWRGLPELTNADGSYCPDSCRTQAWSMACLLEVLWE